MARIDLNADLGEEAGDDAAMLDLVTSAAVACGFHAGGPAVMARTASLAAARGVALGAHPSYADRDGFGRRDLDVPHAALVADIAYQVGAMEAVAAAVGGVSGVAEAGGAAAGAVAEAGGAVAEAGGAAVGAGLRVRFVKLHGALYNRAAADPAVADAVIEAALGAFPSLPILCPPDSELARRASAAGLVVKAEGFADRAYMPDGSLMPRSQEGAVLHDPAAVASQAERLAREGRFDSICLHGDTPGAIALAGAVRRGLEDAGIEIAPFT